MFPFYFYSIKYFKLLKNLKNKIIDFYDNLIIIYVFSIYNSFIIFNATQSLCFTKISCSTFTFLFFYYLLGFLISKNLKNATLGIITVMIVLFGYKSIKSDIDQNNGIVFEKIQKQINLIDELGITKLYGDYWLSYPISFITKERIIIEPLYTNYILIICH